MILTINVSLVYHWLTLFFSLSHTWPKQYWQARDYQSKRVNPPSRPSNQANPSQVTSRHCTQLLRGYYLRVAWMFSWRISLFSFRFVSKQNRTSNAVEMSSLIFWLQAREPRLSVCFNTLRNFSRSLNKRRMSPAQTMTTEWTAEKCFDKRAQSKQTRKHKLGNWTNRWSKVQADACTVI